MQQDAGAKPIPSPADGEVLVQLSSGHTATLPATSLPALKQQDPNYKYIADKVSPAQKQLVPNYDTLTAVAGSDHRYRPATVAGDAVRRLWSFRHPARQRPTGCGQDLGCRKATRDSGLAPRKGDAENRPNFSGLSPSQRCGQSYRRSKRQ